MSAHRGYAPFSTSIRTTLGWRFIACVSAVVYWMLRPDGYVDPFDLKNAQLINTLFSGALLLAIDGTLLVSVCLLPDNEKSGMWIVAVAAGVVLSAICYLSEDGRVTGTPLMSILVGLSLSSVHLFDGNRRRLGYAVLAAACVVLMGIIFIDYVVGIAAMGTANSVPNIYYASLAFGGVLVALMLRERRFAQTARLPRAAKVSR